MKLTKLNKYVKTSLRNPLPPAVKRSPKRDAQDLENILLSQSSQAMYSPPWADRIQINWISCWVGTCFNTQLVDVYCLNTSTFVRQKRKNEDCLQSACLDNLVINNNNNHKL